jgi:hypothetical protein
VIGHAKVQRRERLGVLTQKPRPLVCKLTDSNRIKFIVA